MCAVSQFDPAVVTAFLAVLTAGARRRTRLRRPLRLTTMNFITPTKGERAP